MQKSVIPFIHCHFKATRKQDRQYIQEAHTHMRGLFSRWLVVMSSQQTSFLRKIHQIMAKAQAFLATLH